MSQSPEELIGGLYAAFGRGDVPAVLAMLDEHIEWHAPENLPHGGNFRGRDDVGRFFQGLDEQWEGLEVELDGLISGGDRVVALLRARGRLRGSGEDSGYSSVHVWTVRGGSAVRFDEYVNAPLSLPAAAAITS